MACPARARALPDTAPGRDRAALQLAAQCREAPRHLAAPPALALGQWAYAGRWTVSYQRGLAGGAPGALSIRFRARDLHLALGSAGGNPVRFRVALDGAAPGADAGLDIDPASNGVVTGQRLYQLVRHRRGARERLFTITFLDPGAEAYAFTFG